MMLSVVRLAIMICCNSVNQSRSADEQSLFLSSHCQMFCLFLQLLLLAAAMQLEEKLMVS